MVLTTISLLKNISLKDTKSKDESSDEVVKSIFSKIDFENDKKKSKEDAIEKLRNYLMPKILKKQTIILLIGFFILLFVVAPFEIVGMVLVMTAMGYVFLIYYPQLKDRKNYSDLNRELPYALRHMGIELKAGKGLHDTLLTIKNADYGSFSKELNRVLEEIKFGKSTEEALLEMGKRINSEGLSRAIQQMIGTLRVGGNLANSLDVIASDITFEMQIKLKEYSQKLNSFILIYTFIAILAPVIILVMLMASSTVMGDIISTSVLMLMYCAFFPMVVMFMGVFIKKLEPKI